MREIKFRAWVIPKKEMIFDVGFHPYICRREEGYRRDDGGAFTVSPLFESYILMQYTGLKDKNGKEIYEGDIVHWQGGPRKWKVSWDEEWASYELICLNDESYKNDDFGGDYTKNYEIIGNIYENPELLNKTLDI